MEQIEDKYNMISIDQFDKNCENITAVRLYIEQNI